ncbi:MAG: DUF4328 domain-containing protein [Myxococcales bacterium]|nr:DUF4328 domain-containing protein [Myxococcales bacterium]
MDHPWSIRGDNVSPWRVLLLFSGDSSQTTAAKKIATRPRGEALVHVTYYFRSPRALGAAATIFVFLQVCAAFFLDAVTLAVGQPADDDLGGALLLLAASLAQLFTLLLAAATVLAWVHRVASNVRALGQEGLQMTPGWAVGVWFIPFANLVRPYIALKEIFAASDPQTIGGGAAWRGGRVPKVLGLWWGAWLLSGFLNNITAQIQWREPSAGTTVGFVATAFGLLAATALASFVTALGRRQDAAWTRFASMGWGHAHHAAPPPWSHGPYGGPGAPVYLRAA